MIDDKGLEILGNKISQHLKKLKKISINFSNHKQITERALEVLTLKIIRSCKDLEHFNLNVSS